MAAKNPLLEALPEDRKEALRNLTQRFGLDWSKATIRKLEPGDWPGATKEELENGLVVAPAPKIIPWDKLPWPPCKFSVGDTVITAYRKTEAYKVRTVEEVCRSMDAIQTGYLVKVTGIGKHIEAAWLKAKAEDISHLEGIHNKSQIL